MKQNSKRNYQMLIGFALMVWMFVDLLFDGICVAMFWDLLLVNCVWSLLCLLDFVGLSYSACWEYPRE